MTKRILRPEEVIGEQSMGLRPLGNRSPIFKVVVGDCRDRPLHMGTTVATITTRAVISRPYLCGLGTIPLGSDVPRPLVPALLLILRNEY